MALARGRRGRSAASITGRASLMRCRRCCLAFVFLITVFMVAQFFLSRDVSPARMPSLAKLNKQIEQLTSLLALEKTTGGAKRPTGLAVACRCNASPQQRAAGIRSASATIWLGGKRRCIRARAIARSDAEGRDSTRDAAKQLSAARACAGR